MLPFLKPKKAPGVIIAHTKPDGSHEMSYREGEEDHALKACATDLIRAVHSKDEDSVAEALKAAFTILDAMPHVEGEHLEESEE